MSLLFQTAFLGHPIHVLDIRGRAAFFMPEIGVAAGHMFGGERFVTLVTREWAEALEDDHDVAILTTREFERAKRDTGLPLSTRESLVLFAPGVRKALAKSNARHAGQLQAFLDEDVYPRVAAKGVIRVASGVPSEGERGPSLAAPPPPGPSLAPAAESEAFVRRCTEYLTLRRYARLLLVHQNDVEGYMLVERLAVEALLGRGLDSAPWPAGPATATAAQVA